MRVEGDALLGSSAKTKQRRSNVCILLYSPPTPDKLRPSAAPRSTGEDSLPGMRENPAVLRFEKLLLDEVLLV